MAARQAGHKHPDSEQRIKNLKEQLKKLQQEVRDLQQKLQTHDHPHTH
jgi:chaperonin cofactor prefoldin